MNANLYNQAILIAVLLSFIATFVKQKQSLLETHVHERNSGQTLNFATAALAKVGLPQSFQWSQELGSLVSFRLGNLLGVFDAEQAQQIGQISTETSLISHTSNLVKMVGTPLEGQTFAERIVALSSLLGSSQTSTISSQLVSINQFLGDTSDVLGQVKEVSEIIGDTSILEEIGFQNIPTAIASLSLIIGSSLNNETVIEAVDRLFGMMGEPTIYNSTIYGILGQVKRDIANLENFLNITLPIINSVIVDPVTRGQASVQEMCTQRGSYFVSDGSRVRLGTLPSLNLSSIFYPDEATDMTEVDLTVSYANTDILSFISLANVDESWYGFITQDSDGSLLLENFLVVTMPFESQEAQVICNKLHASTFQTQNIKLIDPSNVDEFVFINGDENQVLSMGAEYAEWQPFWPTTAPELSDILFFNGNANGMEITNICGPKTYFGTSASTGQTGWFDIDPMSESYNMIKVEQTIWCNRLQCSNILLKDTFTGNILSGRGAPNAVITSTGIRSAFTPSSSGVYYNLENLPHFEWWSGRWVPKTDTNYLSDTTFSTRTANHVVVWGFFMQNMSNRLIKLPKPPYQPYSYPDGTSYVVTNISDDVYIDTDIGEIKINGSEKVRVPGAQETATLLFDEIQREGSNDKNWYNYRIKNFVVAYGISLNSQWVFHYDELILNNEEYMEPLGFWNELLIDLAIDIIFPFKKFGTWGSIGLQLGLGVGQFFFTYDMIYNNYIIGPPQF